MFSDIHKPTRDKFCLYVTISCKGKKKFRVWAEDYQKINSKYSDREIIVEGKRIVHLNFPVSPKNLFIGILNSESPKDTEFEVQIIEGALTTYNTWLDEGTKKFVKLATHFSQVCGFENASNIGRLFTTKDKEFSIRYFNVIHDFKTGRAMNTPARIGHQTGIIETAKWKFDKYTIPMRMIILLHEYAHKYKNPRIGLEISDEIGADINALYIYLGLGYSKIDAICVFANVFLKAQTKGNIERMRKIMDYIQKFENQEFAERN